MWLIIILFLLPVLRPILVNNIAHSRNLPTTTRRFHRQPLPPTPKIPSWWRQPISQQDQTRGNKLSFLGIVGGELSQDDEWPMMVSVMWQANHFCGGTIWSPQYIVTAAHCFYFNNGSMVPLQNIEVYVGHSDITQLDPNYLFAVQQMIPHDAYSASAVEQGNDIGLIKLAKPIPSNIQCACRSLATDAVIPNQCYVVGWGRTHLEDEKMPLQLREVRVPLLDAAFCLKYSASKTFDVNSQLCAGFLDGGHDACKGDSGGPLMCAISENPYVYELTGIVSFGVGCAKAYSPGYYTRVAYYNSWLKTNTGCG